MMPSLLPFQNSRLAVRTEQVPRVSGALTLWEAPCSNCALFEPDRISSPEETLAWLV